MRRLADHLGRQYSKGKHLRTAALSSLAPLKVRSSLAQYWDQFRDGNDNRTTVLQYKHSFRNGSVPVTKISILASNTWLQEIGNESGEVISKGSSSIFRIACCTDSRENSRGLLPKSSLDSSVSIIYVPSVTCNGYVSTAKIIAKISKMILRFYLDRLQGASAYNQSNRQHRV